MSEPFAQPAPVLRGAYSVAPPPIAPNPSRGVLSYKEFTTTKTATSSTETSAVTVVSADTVTLDGTTLVAVEFSAPGIGVSDNTNGCILTLFDGTTSTVLGQLWEVSQIGANAQAVPLSGVYVKRYFTPTVGPHTFFVGILDNGAITSNHAKVFAGAGGSGAPVPGYIQVTGL